MYELLHAGLDTMDVAFAGALPEGQYPILESAREEALKKQEDVLTELGPGKIAMHVACHGMRGGYAYVADTGPLGTKWFLKNNTDPRQWNIFARPKATTLLTRGYAGTRDLLFRELEAMGVRPVDHSVNRVDFAMDFRTHGFEPQIARFVAHAHAKVRPEWSESASEKDQGRPTAILRGRCLETVTIGKMPGRQVILYDKRREAIARQKRFWFKVWGLNQEDKSAQIWRIEIRAGKKELWNRWKLRSFRDIETALGDICAHALDQIRYLADDQRDGNVTRQRLHPLWEAAQSVVRQNLIEFTSGLTANQVQEIERSVAIERYQQIAYSAALGLAVTEGMTDRDIARNLPNLSGPWVAKHQKADPHRHERALRRMRDRLYFID